MLVADTANKTVRLETVPGAGFEPARPFGQRILRAPRFPVFSNACNFLSAIYRAERWRIACVSAGAGGQS